MCCCGRAEPVDYRCMYWLPHGWSDVLVISFYGFTKSTSSIAFSHEHSVSCCGAVGGELVPCTTAPLAITICTPIPECPLLCMGC
jgi:hypothetical protein